jgi:hypothetical protein
MGALEGGAVLAIEAVEQVRHCCAVRGQGVSAFRGKIKETGPFGDGC